MGVQQGELLVEAAREGKGVNGRDMFVVTPGGWVFRSGFQEWLQEWLKVRLKV